MEFCAARRIHYSNAPTPTTPLLWRQAQSSHNPLKIVISVVIDLNPASFVSMMDADMSREMFLQAVPQIFHRRRHSAGLCAGASRLPATADPEQAGNQPLGGTDCGVAAQNSFRSQELLLRCF